jgi:hypothetical protein
MERLHKRGLNRTVRPSGHNIKPSFSKISPGGSTRPYRFGEFDLLAVAMYPSTNEWNRFMYTVSDWLIAGRTDSAEISKFQPVAMTPNDDWTDDFRMAVGWVRSGVKKTIRSS